MYVILRRFLDGEEAVDSKMAAICMWNFVGILSDQNMFKSRTTCDFFLCSVAASVF